MCLRISKIELLTNQKTECLTSQTDQVITIELFPAWRWLIRIDQTQSFLKNCKGAISHTRKKHYSLIGQISHKGIVLDYRRDLQAGKDSLEKLIRIFPMLLSEQISTKPLNIIVGFWASIQTLFQLQAEDQISSYNEFKKKEDIIRAQVVRQILRHSRGRRLVQINCQLTIRIPWISKRTNQLSSITLFDLISSKAQIKYRTIIWMTDKIHQFREKTFKKTLLEVIQ